jgi:glycerol-3-phosphate dehydrogenase
MHCVLRNEYRTFDGKFGERICIYFGKKKKALMGYTDTEIHTTEPQVPEPSASEVELAIERVNSHKSPGIDQITAELIKAGVERLAVRFINLLFLSGVRRNCLRSGRSRSQYLFIRSR